MNDKDVIITYPKLKKNKSLVLALNQYKKQKISLNLEYNNSEIESSYINKFLRQKTNLTTCKNKNENNPRTYQNSKLICKNFISPNTRNYERNHFEDIIYPTIINKENNKNLFLKAKTINDYKYKNIWLLEQQNMHIINKENYINQNKQKKVKKSLFEIFGIDKYKKKKKNKSNHKKKFTPECFIKHFKKSKTINKQNGEILYDIKNKINNFNNHLRSKTYVSIQNDSDEFEENYIQKLNKFINIIEKKFNKIIEYKKEFIINIKNKKNKDLKPKILPNRVFNKRYSICINQIKNFIKENVSLGSSIKLSRNKLYSLKTFKKYFSKNLSNKSPKNFVNKIKEKIKNKLEVIDNKINFNKNKIIYKYYDSLIDYEIIIEKKIKNNIKKINPFCRYKEEVNDLKKYEINKLLKKINIDNILQEFKIQITNNQTNKLKLFTNYLLDNYFEINNLQRIIDERNTYKNATEKIIDYLKVNLLSSKTLFSMNNSYDEDEHFLYYDIYYGIKFKSMDIYIIKNNIKNLEINIDKKFKWNNIYNEFIKIKDNKKNNKNEHTLSKKQIKFNVKLNSNKNIDINYAVKNKSVPHKNKNENIYKLLISPKNKNYIPKLSSLNHSKMKNFFTNFKLRDSSSPNSNDKDMNLFKKYLINFTQELVNKEPEFNKINFNERIINLRKIRKNIFLNPDLINDDIKRTNFYRDKKFYAIIFQYIKDNKDKDLLTSIKYIFENANLNFQDHNGDTLLHVCAFNDISLDVFEFLIERGVNINIQNKNGDTALHIAFKSRNFEIVNFLIKMGANENLRNRENKTPWEYV